MSAIETMEKQLPKQPIYESHLPSVRPSFSDLQSFELMQRAAKLISSSSLVPKEYQGNLPNCVIALNMAQRIGADPLMVMQNLYVVYGRPGWSAQFLIATFNQCGRFSALRYEWFGEKGKDSYGCRAWATEKETGEKIVGADITIDLAKKESWYEKSGSKWKTMPQQMLMYRAASWLIRAHAPEIAMGLQTAEELHDIFDMTPDEKGTFAVSDTPMPKKNTLSKGVEAAKQEIKKATVIDPSTGEIIPEFVERPETHSELFLDLLKCVKNAQSKDDFDLIKDRARELLPENQKKINKMCDDRFAQI